MVSSWIHWAVLRLLRYGKVEAPPCCHGRAARDQAPNTNQEVAKKFKDWVEEAITHYKNGNRSTRFMSSAHDTLAREQSVDMVSGVKGKVKLYTTYEPRWGDPRTNSLGHTFCKDYRWKDGTLRLGGFLTLLH